MPDIIKQRDLIRIIEGRVTELARLIARCRALNAPPKLRESQQIPAKKPAISGKKPTISAKKPVIAAKTRLPARP